MNTDPTFADLQEMLKLKCISRKFIMKRYLGLTDDDLQELAMSATHAKNIKPCITEMQDAIYKRELTMSDDTNNIVFDEDSGSWAINIPNGNAASGSVSGNSSIGVGGGFVVTSVNPGAAVYGTPVNLTGGGHNAFTNISISFDPVTEKHSVAYVIVLADDSCLELEEQPSITPREMIGICKFIMMASAANNLDNISWSMLMSTLKIARHFKITHASHDQYDAASNVLYVKLFDPR